MNRPSSQYLTHPYPAWSGCTLNEILIIWGICLVFDALCLFIFTLLAGGRFTGLLCFLAWIPLTIAVVKAVLKIMEPIKERRQAGYVLIKARLFLAEITGLRSPYVTRVGRWITRC